MSQDQLEVSGCFHKICWRFVIVVMISCRSFNVNRSVSDSYCCHDQLEISYCYHKISWRSVVAVTRLVVDIVATVSVGNQLLLPQDQLEISY